MHTAFKRLAFLIGVILTVCSFQLGSNMPQQEESWPRNTSSRFASASAEGNAPVGAVNTSEDAFALFRNGSPFSGSAYDEGNHTLALVAAELNAAAEEAGTNLPKVYGDLGFAAENISYYNYDGASSPPSTRLDGSTGNEHCFSIAMRTMDILGEKQLVIAVILRGTSGEGWSVFQEPLDDAFATANKSLLAGNESVMVFDYFLWFAQKAEGELYKKFESDYAKKYIKEGKYKILLSGHSLGGAAANLLAVKLSNDAHIDDANTYVFTFGALNSIGLYENPSNIRKRVPSFRNIRNYFNFYDTYGPFGDGALIPDVTHPGYGVKPAYGQETYEYKFGENILFFCTGLQRCV